MARPKAAAMDFRAKMMEQAKKRWEETLRNSATKQNEVSISTVRADAALESLNKILEKGKFNTSHGGSVSFEKPVELCLKDGPHVIKFPLSAEDEQKLLKVCEQASFGKGKEEVLDPEYRQALRLEGDKFFTSFDLHTTSLLGEIQAALCPDQKNVTLTAELDKLNVYTKGGFFKKHQDTPRGNDVIGTLTLVLPTSFEGGELVVDGRGDSAAAAVFGWPDKVRLSQLIFYILITVQLDFLLCLHVLLFYRSQFFKIVENIWVRILTLMSIHGWTSQQPLAAVIQYMVPLPTWKRTDMFFNACRLQYAAFFSDSQHEIKPVTSGCRVSIAYNLISKPKQLQSAVFPPLATELAAQLEVSKTNAMSLPCAVY